MPVVDVKALLAQPTDAVERPPILPVGHFVGTILRNEFDKSRAKKTPLVRFILGLEEPSDDIDPDDMAGIKLTGIELRAEFYLTPKSMYRLADFLDAVLGEASGQGFDERIPETTGVQVLIGVRQRVNDEGDPTGNEVTTVVAYK